MSYFTHITFRVSSMSVPMTRIKYIPRATGFPFPFVPSCLFVLQSVDKLLHGRDGIEILRLKVFDVVAYDAGIIPQNRRAYISPYSDLSNTFSFVSHQEVQALIKNAKLQPVTFR